jgi:type IV pilus assembly protein PilQ
MRTNRRTLLSALFAAVLAAGTLHGQAEPGDEGRIRVSVTGYGQYDDRLTMDLKGADLRNVLRLLAEQNGLNVIAGPDVTGEVTVRLEDVTVDEALRNILRSNGYQYVRDENVIRVEPLTSISPEEELEVRVFHLLYVDGRDVKAALEGVLSEKGSVHTFSRSLGAGQEGSVRSDVVIVNDLPIVIPKIEEIISAIDVPEPQIMIEARIIETVYSKQDRAGVAWPNTFQLLYSKLSFEEKFTSSGGTGTTEQIGSSFQWGRLSAKEFQGAIDILSQEQNTKLISNPRITTLNNQRAEIAVTTSVPIQTVNRFSFAAESQDVASYEYIDIGITLVVTPRVNEGNTITMEVAPTIEEISGFTGPVEFQVPITTKRSTVTHIRVEDNETIVIGGLLKDNRGETISKLWLLGDIPIIGRLFQHRTLKEEQNDLLIFVTPHIVDG